jgi:hypothetical protein
MASLKLTRRQVPALLTGLLVATFLPQIGNAQSAKPLGPIVKTMKKLYKARVIDARPVSKNGRTLYRIKLLTKKQKLRVVYVDPVTGNRV